MKVLVTNTSDIQSTSLSRNGAAGDNHRPNAVSFDLKRSFFLTGRSSSIIGPTTFWFCRERKKTSGNFLVSAGEKKRTAIEKIYTRVECAACCNLHPQQYGVTRRNEGAAQAANESSRESGVCGVSDMTTCRCCQKKAQQRLPLHLLTYV